MVENFHVDDSVLLFMQLVTTGPPLIEILFLFFQARFRSFPNKQLKKILLVDQCLPEWWVVVAAAACRIVVRVLAHIPVTFVAFAIFAHIFGIVFCSSYILLIAWLFSLFRT